jgi:hypothetical protein
MVDRSQLVKFAFSGYAVFVAMEEAGHPSPNEIVRRKVVHNLYYAAFHVARHYALNTDATLPSTIRHEDLWNWFGKQKGGTGKVRQQGSKLREIRNKADYDIAKDFLIDVGQVLEVTKAIIGAIDQPMLDECLPTLTSFRFNSE